MNGDDWKWGHKPPVKVEDKAPSTRAASDSTRIPDVAGPEDIHESSQSPTRGIPMAGAQMMGDLSRFNGDQNPNPGLDPVKMNVDPHIQDDIGLPHYKPNVDSVSAGASKLNSLKNPQIIRDSARDIAGGSLHNYSTLCDGQERVGDNFTVNTDCNMEVACDNNSNAEGKLPPKSRVPATSGPYSYNFQVASGYGTFPKYGNVFSRPDGNVGVAHSSNVSSNLRRNSSAKSADKECHQSLPQDERDIEVPYSGVNGQRVVPSFTHDANQPSHEKPLETVETAGPLLDESSRNSSFVDLTANMAVQDQLAAGQQSTVHQVAGASGLFPKTARPELARTSGQSFAAIHVQPLKDLPGPDCSAAADGCFPSEASDVGPFPSLNKGAIQPSPASTPVQQKSQKSTQPSSNPSLANATPSFTHLPQNSPSRPLVSQAPPSLPPVPHIAIPVRPQTHLAHRQAPTRQMAFRAVHAQSIRVNTNKPSSGPYIANKIRASPATTPLLHNSSVPFIEPVTDTFPARPLPMRLAQAPRRPSQTNPTRPLLLRAAALQLLANQAQASSSAPPLSNYVLPAAHINFRDLDSAPLPMGTKCSLCKCDLRSLPKVPTLQPDTPPAVAVLPCRHAFHDQCLRDVTPEEQAQDPPCLLCATDES